MGKVFTGADNFIEWADLDVKCAELIFDFSIETKDKKYFNIDHQASYLCSQAAEKYLKAYLFYQWEEQGESRESIFSKLRHLGHKNQEILNACVKENDSFNSIQGLIAKLEPYELLKYPDEAEKLIFSPDGLSTGTDSVKQAISIGIFVKEILS